MVAQREALAIAELAVYIPLSLLDLVVVFRLGLHRQLGWVYLLAFCGIRIVGAIFEILYANNPNSSTDAEWSGILQSIGLSPLILASFGLLKRVIDFTSERVASDPSSLGNMAVELLSQKIGIVKRVAGKATAVSRRSRLIQILQIPATVALILCIVGGLDEGDSDASDISTGKTLFKVGIIMFLVLYLIIVLLTLVSLGELRKTPQEERRVLVTVLICLPLLASRMVWSILSVFTTSSTFNMQGGSIYAQAFMATVEEFLIVVTYTAVGFTVHKYVVPKRSRYPGGARRGYQPAQSPENLVPARY